MQDTPYTEVSVEYAVNGRPERLQHDFDRELVKLEHEAAALSASLGEISRDFVGYIFGATAPAARAKAYVDMLQGRDAKRFVQLEDAAARAGNLMTKIDALRLHFMVGNGVIIQRLTDAQRAFLDETGLDISEG